MVSVVLLTTEEVLQRNGFWYRLDTMWVTEEMEPFEEIKPEHLFVKPLTRDIYYAKYPEIPRSESEDESSLSIHGFKNKHREWKSKIQVKKIVSQRKYLATSQITFRLSNTNASIDNISRRVTSLVEENKNSNNTSKTLKTTNNDDRIRAFFNRLLESVPPPPIENSENVRSDHSIVPPQRDNDFDDIDVPDYSDFEKDKLVQTKVDCGAIATTSTLKKSQRRVSFNLSNIKTDASDQWNDSIYGLSENNDKCLELQSGIGETNIDNLPDEESCPSWSEIIQECGINDSIVKSNESIPSTEELLTQSHAEVQSIRSLQEDDGDDEAVYARFAIYKIYQSLKFDGKMKDSSSLKDLRFENIEENKQIKADRTFYESTYSLVPKTYHDSQESVIEHSAN